MNSELDCMTGIEYLVISYIIVYYYISTLYIQLNKIKKKNSVILSN